MSIQVNKKGQNLLRDPLLNKGTAFNEKEKHAFELTGLLPSNTETIQEQLKRCREAFDNKDKAIEKHIYLRALQDRNEVLFYRFILENLTEMMPFIYTPVVGEACQYFHHIYRQPRGLFISYPERDQMDHILHHISKSRTVSVIVVTDGERILGLGDQGAGGLGIPIGKLSLYTACGGISPAETLPIILDVGTNNQERLDDPEYLGWRHERVTDDAYYEFVDLFVSKIKQYFPDVLLQFEDFAQTHAYPILQKYQDKLCTFNDDIQGTAAVSVAAILAATHISGTPLKEHKIAVLGAGSAGCGISEQLVHAMQNEGLSENEARERFYLVDRDGLLHEGMDNLLDFQQKFARSNELLHSDGFDDSAPIPLGEVMTKAHPTILLGVSGQPNQFTETIVKAMNEHCDRPIIFPLSNPTSRAEATPHDLLNWTDGQALVATGSPYDPVLIHNKKIDIEQCNNSYIFPGMGLAVVACQAKRVTDEMMMAAATALSELAPAMSSGEGRLLPELKTIRKVSQHIAKAVIKKAIAQGHANKMDDKEIDDALMRTMWEPEYQPFEAC